MKSILPLLLCAAVCCVSLAEDTSPPKEQQLIGTWVRHEMTTHTLATNGLTSIRFLPDGKVEWTMNLVGFGKRKRTGTYSVEVSGHIIWPEKKGPVLRIRTDQDTRAAESPGAPIDANFRETGGSILLFLTAGQDIDCRFPLGAYVLKLRDAFSEFIFTREDSQPGVRR